MPFLQEYIMEANFKIENKERFKFTVQRIAILQNLLSRADRRQVNKFIDEIRQTVYLYHQHEHEIKEDVNVSEQDQFFTRLNDKAHQLARFTTELSMLVKGAPVELFEKAKKADRAIDAVHGNLVDVCLTIDDLLNQKDQFIIDIHTTVRKIHDAYIKAFNVKPNGRYYVTEADVPANGYLEDLLVPVVQILTHKSRDRSYKLVKQILK